MTEDAREPAPAQPPPHRAIEVGRPDSVLERAADRTAEAVSGRSAGAPRASAPRPGGSVAPPLVHEVLRSPGSRLDPGTREAFEPAFGVDLSGVRLHEGAAASASARAVGAAAYTVGSHVVFGAGRHAPDTAEGRALMAHELAHVLQRRGGLLQRAPDPAAVEELPAAPTGPLASADAWVTRLRAEFEAYGDDHVPDRYAAGRAWRIFELVCLPDLRRQAEAGAGGLTQAAVDEAVAFAREEGATEHLAAMRIDIRENYTLFPETLVRWYDEEAATLRRFLAFDPEPRDDDWKLRLAQAGDHDQFLFLSEAYETERIEAGLLEDAATDISGGIFPEVSFEDHKRLLADEAHRRAREAGEAEYQAYVARAADPEGTRAAVEGRESAQALSQQDVTADQELVTVEGFAMKRRLDLGTDVMPAPVLEAWLKAQAALMALNPVIRAGTMAPKAQGQAADAVQAFLVAFRAQVEGYDVEQQTNFTLEPPETFTTNPYVSHEVAYFVPRLREARTPADWAWPVAVFEQVVDGLDRYIADQLTARGRAPEADELRGAGALTEELSSLRAEHPDVEKVPAVFYPDAEELRDKGPPGAPDFSVSGLPLFWYLHRKGGVWYLTDLTDPTHPKVVDDAGGTEDAPAPALFEQLNTALRFPVGHLYWQLPDDGPGNLATTAEWGPAEYLAFFSAVASVAAIGIAIAVASGGAAVPEEIVLLVAYTGGALSAGAAGADIAAKSQAGVLTTEDVVVDTVALAGALAGVGSAKLGQIAASNAVKTAAGLSRLEALAGQAFLPVTVAGAVAGGTSFAILLGDTPERLAAIDGLPGSDRDRTLARARLVGVLLLSGAMVLLSVRGIPRDTPTLQLDVAPDGTPVVRLPAVDPELAMTEATTPPLETTDPTSAGPPEPRTSVVEAPKPVDTPQTVETPPLPAVSIEEPAGAPMQAEPDTSDASSTPTLLSGPLPTAALPLPGSPSTTTSSATAAGSAQVGPVAPAAAPAPLTVDGLRRQLPGVNIDGRSAPRLNAVELLNQLSPAQRQPVINALSSLAPEEAGPLLTEMGRFANAPDALFALEQHSLGPFGVPRPAPPVAPGSAAVWEQLKQAVGWAEPRQPSKSWGFRSQTARDGNFEMTIIEGTVGEQIDQIDTFAGYIGTLKGEDATHAVAMQVGENVPEGITSAPLAFNRSDLKVVENAIRQVYDAGAVVETKTAIMVELQMVKGQPTRVMVGVIREAWVQEQSESATSLPFVDFEALIDPVTRQVTIIRNRIGAL